MKHIFQGQAEDDGYGSITARVGAANPPIVSVLVGETDIKVAVTNTATELPLNCH